MVVGAQFIVPQHTNKDLSTNKLLAMEGIEVRDDGLFDIKGLTVNEVQNLKVTIKAKHYSFNASKEERKFDDDFVTATHEAQRTYAQN